MDLGEDYILMCSKAQEIQNQRKKFLDGDFLVSCRINWESVGELEKKGVVEFLDTHVYNNSLGINDRGLCIWLPRQDQLQEILLGKVNYFGYNPNSNGLSIALVKEIETFQGQLHTVNINNYKIPHDTLEKWWVMLIMYRIYDKIWNPETKEWEKV